MNMALVRHGIRLGLAAGLAMAIVKLFGLQSGFWAALSALAVLQTQLGASLVSARNYLIASAIGVAFGVATLTLFGESILVAAVGVTLLALLCMRLNLPPASVTTAGGVIPVLVLSVTESPWRYGAYRLIDVVVGVTVAMLVSALVWPSRSGDALRRSVADVVRFAGEHVADALDGLLAGGPPAGSTHREIEIQQHLQAAQGMLGAAQHEPTHAHNAQGLLAFYLANGERIFEHASQVAEVAAGGLSPASLSAVGPQLQAVGAASTTAAAALGEAIAGVEMPAALEHARTAATVLSDATSELSERDLSQTAHGHELLRLHTLVLGLQAFAGEIERTVRRIEHPEQAITPDERVRLPAAVTTATPNVKTWWRRARP